jgi:hypothetical protein
MFTPFAFRSIPLSSKLAFRQPTWTASCRCRAVATNPQNSWKARRIRFQRFQYPRIVRGSSPAEFGQHRRPMGTCFSRGHVASMESVTYTARNTRFPANLDSSGSIRKRGFLWLRGWFACARRRLRGRAQTAVLAVHRSVYLASHLPEHQWIAAGHLVDVDGWNGSSARAIQRRDQLDRDHGVAGVGRMNSAE